MTILCSYLPRGPLAHHSTNRLTQTGRRAWKRRRVIDTNEIIAFANMNDDVMIDCIPLSEIISIQANGETWKSDPGSAPPTSQNVSIPFPGANPGPTIAADSHEIFEIHTEPGGYNSGNTYYLQTTEQELADVLPKFKMNIEIAVRRTKQTTLRTCAHNIIKSIFTNYYFQLFIAFMIILVRYPPLSPPLALARH